MTDSVATYTIHIVDEDTGFVLEWRGMCEAALDWITSTERPASEVIEVLGPPASIFWEEQ
jgi:hypothetical protein